MRATCFSKKLGEFILSYDAVRTAREPERTLMEVLQKHLRGGGFGGVGESRAGV